LFDAQYSDFMLHGTALMFFVHHKYLYIRGLAKRV